MPEPEFLINILCSLFQNNAAAAAKLHQSCPTLCDPVDGSPPGSSTPGILQARILEWAAIFSSKGSSNLDIESASPTLQADSLPSEP